MSNLAEELANKYFVEIARAGFAECEYDGTATGEHVKPLLIKALHEAIITIHSAVQELRLPQNGLTQGYNEAIDDALATIRSFREAPTV